MTPSPRSCCRAGVRTTGTVTPPPGRWRGAARWAAPLVPAAGLALVPKCPACLAAYVAAVTGAGVSVGAATHLRAAMLATCVLSLLYLLVRCAWRYLG